ncbi:hypothetical protein D3C75_573950 [compost metagenome]
MEILHAPADEPQNILGLDMRNLTQENRHEQALEGPLIHNGITFDRKLQIRQCFSVLQQMQVPF